MNVEFDFTMGKGTPAGDHSFENDDKNVGNQFWSRQERAQRPDIASKENGVL